MLNAINIILLIILSNVSINAQGFDWQYSARLPQNPPELFIGPSLGVNYSIHKGKIDLNESNTPCCSFTDGTGTGFDFGIGSEYWLNNQISITAIFEFFNVTGNFENDGDNLPLADGSRFKTKFSYASSKSFVNLSIGAKSNLFSTNFYIGAGLGVGILSIDDSEHLEEIVSEHLFNDGTKSRIITNGVINGSNNIVYISSISIGYDISIDNGIFISPNLSLKYPIGGLASYSKWDVIALRAGILLYYGIY